MRYKVMSIMDESTSDIIYDPGSINWTTFLWSQGYFKHYVSEIDILKPYNISYAYYKDTQYEDVILLLNGIENVWNLYQGAMLKIPKLDELNQFILDNIK